MDKYLSERNRLEEYLNLKNISYNTKKKTYRCPNPNHIDENESAVLYKNATGHVLYCPVCSESWSIFEVCGFLEGLTEFKDKLKSVRKIFNIIEEKYFPFPEDKESINNQIKNIAKNKKWGEIKGSWKYYNKKNEIIALDVRFENSGERKIIITFWYDGHLTWQNTPVFIYNLHLISDDKPILIHEGAKCADIGQKNFSGFVNISWSGGCGKAHLADWSIIKNNKKIYILPDNDIPGIKAALKIKEQLPHAKIIKPLDSIKEKGADIEQILQKFSPEEFIELMEEELMTSVSSTSLEPPPSNLQPEPAKNISSSSINSVPFKILGIGDDGKAAFITEANRLVFNSLDSLSKNKLMVLANRDYWYENYKNKDGKISWETAIDDIIRIAQEKDFLIDDIRGRGAWRDGDKISYHDGYQTFGEHAKNKIYLRLPRQDIGIQDEPINPKITKKIKENVFKMSFETLSDAVRCLGWSAIAPFAGVLKYRPSILLTGPSGSGKSVLQSLLLKKLTNFLWVDAAETSVAGVRGKLKYDNGAVFFEEADKDTDKKKVQVNNIFSFMRANFTDDAPDALKGTKEGGFTSYKMNAIFGFASIDPTVDHVADENRIFRINMIKPQNANEWKSLEDTLLKLLSEKNCRAIRALTWSKLKNIFALADRIVDIIREKTKKDFRSSYADSLLASAFVIIWDGIEKPSDEQLEKMLDKYFAYQPVEENRDDAEELIERLLDETIEILDSHERQKMTIMEALTKIYENELLEKEIQNIKLHVARYGIRIVDESNIAIANRHHVISKIINRGAGYNKIFKRHKGFVEGQRLVYFFDGGKPRRCTIIKNILQKKDNLGVLMF
jgi:5S rRNA maturation endonuclease (ribonuclease M5)